MKTLLRYSNERSGANTINIEIVRGTKNYYLAGTLGGFIIPFKTSDGLTACQHDWKIQISEEEYKTIDKALDGHLGEMKKAIWAIRDRMEQEEYNKRYIK